MKVHIAGDTSHLSRLRTAHTLALKNHLAALMTDAMIAEARVQGGMVPTAQLKKMCSYFAAACADAVMGELCTIGATITVSPSDLSAGLRGGTTQAIIDQYARPKLAEKMALAYLQAGLGQTILEMKTHGLAVEFSGWSHAFRNADGPAAQTDEPLVYEGVTVYPAGPRHTMTVDGDEGRRVEEKLRGIISGPSGSSLGRDGGDR